MSKIDHSFISTIISELRSNTNLDVQEYKDFFVSVFFVFFMSSHRRDLIKDIDSNFLESLSTTHGDNFFSKLLLTAEQVDIFYKSELGLRETIEHLITRGGKVNAIDFRQACIKLYDVVSRSEFPAVAGDCFEKIIQDFSETQGKRAGEAYTPRELVEMMVEIVEPRGGESVYDPTCGSGGFLISANIKALNSKVHTPVKIHGREINLSAARIAKINCIVHGIADGDIRISDSLQSLEVSAYDIVLANPPFSLVTDSYQRSTACSYLDFGVPPPSNADFAFLQMIIKSLKPGGRAAVLIPNGVLFRSGVEEGIRTRIIQAGIIEAVISLPSGMLKYTGIPTAILVLRKPGAANKPVLLIDAAEAKSHVDASLSVPLKSLFCSALKIYKNFEEVEGVSKLITTDELERNSYILNISRYMLTQQVQKMSLPDLTKKQRELEVRLAELQREFSELLAENEIKTY
ncbi:class I SAM-dependent DNA methyltransferase [Pseudomonas sp. GL-R-19]|uniref:HsdM family class I SAM-dependent methyltransferase n=1 Tax=Pseudomonas sp. GL-R-19 TaxID=2832391 RepID=UPI001CC10578|nr:N-6 DNA methylase [Pseudomonas sp. GL-R-19]